MSDSVTKFYSQNPQCKAFLNKDTSNDDDNCSGSSNSGAACGALGSIGAGSTCSTTSEGVKENTKLLLECQQLLFQHATVMMITILNEDNDELFEILEDEGIIYKTEINTAKEQLDGEIKVMEIVSLFTFGLLLLIVIFLLLMKNFR